MKVSTIGIDLAKNVFQLHGVNEFGKPVIKKQIRRDQMAEFFVNLPACLIGMEACGGAHYWARKLQGFGHTVKLMAPQFVKPYVKTNKNDAADAEAICEAVARPNMRFVPIKDVEQQSVLALHTVRHGLNTTIFSFAKDLRRLNSWQNSKFDPRIQMNVGVVPALPPNNSSTCASAWNQSSSSWPPAKFLASYKE